MKTTKINRFKPCEEAKEYMLSQRNYKEAWNNCERGDWMLWVAFKLKVDDRKFTFTKATIANQVRHLMKDQRSKDAVDACFRYANNEISRDELNTAAAAYAAAAYAADAAAAYAAADAAAAYAAAAYAVNAAAAAAAYAACAVNAAARKISLKTSADICRQYLTEEVFNAYRKLGR